MVFVYEHYLRFLNDIFYQVRMIKPSFRSECGKEEPFLKQLDLTLLDERVIVFHYGISSRSEIQLKFLLLSRNENDVFQVIFPKEQLFQKVVLFSDLLDELCFLFKLGFEIDEFSSFVVS